MKTKILWVITVLFLISSSVNGQNDGESDPMRDLIHEYGMKGYENVYYNINLDTAEHYLLKALNLQYTTLDYEIDTRVAANHIAIASVYRLIFNYSGALFHLTKAEEILNEKEPNSLHFVSLYNNKGNIYRALNDVYKTKEYYIYALDFMKRNDYQNTIYYSHVFSNYIKLLFELGEYDLAEEKLNMINFSSINIEPDAEIRFNITYATTYSKVGKYDLAIKYFDRARKILKEGPLVEVIGSTLSYYNRIIDFYYSFDEYDKASTYCQEAIVFIESLDRAATKNRLIYRSEINYRVASIKRKLGDFDGALENVNNSIEDLSQFFARLSFSDDQSYEKIEYSSTLPLLYILKSRLLYDQYLISDNKNKIEESLNSYETSINTLNALKLSMKDENSKIFATSTIIEVYNEAIHVANSLYEMTGELNYLEMAFEFTESSKSFALFSEIKNLEAMEFSDLPTEVKARESELTGMIQGYQNMLYKEQMYIEPDSNKIAFYTEKLFHLKQDRDNLMNEIELNYAKYYAFKYQPHFVTLEELQEKLPHRDALIEYVLTDTMLITYVIDKNDINVITQEIGPEFADECLEYYYLLDKQNFSSGVKENYRRFVQLGQKFYTILVEPCLQYTDRKNLTIVPDGPITYIPFEGLLTDEADTEYIDYLHLPYLIRDYSIGYSQSATLMFSERLKSKPTEEKVLAFAPLYPKAGYDMDSSYLRQAKEDTGVLLPLGGIIKEVQSIREMVPAMVFMNEDATEKNFKQHAPDYNVLHLAMHTIMRDDNPLYSWLAFTTAPRNDPADTEDNRLYAYEIYNLSLNANMAVLSSCSSGFGKMHKGEGMMSLARGFYYAGCPSIVMTLWKVTDKSSSELMTDFYKYLKRGKSKQEAMRLAKIDYLETADDLTSNPYFWSGFVVLGDSSPIYKKSGMAYWISILVLFIGLLIYFQYKRRKA